LVSGTTDPEVLAELARGRLRSKLPALRDALEGSFSSHHALMVGKIVAHVDYLDESIADLSVEIERVIAPFSDKVELLDTIPGVDRRMAETLIAEIGVDMDQFPTHKHLASWAGMCPGNEESAGKRRSGKTRKGSKWLRSALLGAAHAASRSKGTYLSAQYARLKGRHGSKKAAVAVGHSILVICYHVLEREVPYEELGEDYFHRQRSGEAYAKRLVRQLELSRSQGSARTRTSIRLAGGRHSTGFSHQAGRQCEVRRTPLPRPPVNKPLGRMLRIAF
jgi:transposase